MKDNKTYKQNYDYSNYDIEDDIIDRGDMTWEQDAGYGDLHEVEMFEETDEYLAAIQEEADYHNEYYLGDHKWGPRQIVLKKNK